APQRIQQGIEQSLSETDRQFLAQPFGSSIKVLFLMREQWDALNLKWTQWVLNFDSDTQSSLLTKWFGESSSVRTIIIMVSLIGGLGILLFGLLMLRTSRQELPETSRIYLGICKKLKPLGFEPQAGETPRQFATRVISARPELAASLSHLIDMYEQLAYADNPDALNQLNRFVTKFRPEK
ncbi:MAG: DUF4129 domain-containing protein, partial [Cellvibrio sp.]